nr:CP [Callistephus mottle virus]
NDNIDAGKDTRKPDKSKVGETPPTPGGTQKSESSSQMVPKNQDKDINLGTSGTFVVPRIKSITAKMRVPKYKGQVALNVEHLLTYTPDESNLSNQIAKQIDFEQWCDKVMEELDITHDQFKIIANGWMAWCIDNGTSPNMSGEWIMMDGTEQITYPMKPFIEHAKPTLRQIMAHYSDVAETYIAMRNTKEVYIPRYARKRNMNDPSLAQYAFDFYVITSKTSNRAREMHAQMKAAALRNVNNKMFGLDGTVGRGDEDTERHTADDVNRNMHTLMGVRQM